jgi:hypothetical protein
VIVAKLNPDLSTLLGVAIIGGAADETWVHMQIGNDGRIYVSSRTSSADYPTTDAAYSRVLQGGVDVAVSVFDSDLSELVASTLLGGDGEEGEPGLMVDGDNNVFIGGTVSASTFPTTVGAYRQAYGGGSTDFFVSKLSSDLQELIASTLIGGRYWEDHSRLVIDNNGFVMICGRTESDDYPVTSGVYSGALSEPAAPGEYRQDGTISKFSNDLSSLVASTYFGVPGYDGAGLAAVDSSGNIIVGGHASSPAYPTTTGAFDFTHNGSNEFFISKFDPQLTTLVASTFLTPDHMGLAQWIFGTGLNTDGDGNIILAGVVWGPLMYTTPDAFDRTFNTGSSPYDGDAVVFILDESLSTVSYATYLGGTSDDPWAMATLTPDSSLLVFGFTASEDFPVSPDAFCTQYSGGASDLYVTRLGYRCCDRRVGNANRLGGDEPTIGDVSVMIDAKFISGTCDGIIECFSEADVNQSGGTNPGCEDITIGDISTLIDYLFITGSSLGLPDCL